MTNTAKPPMVVWLQNQQSLDEEQWQDLDVTWCRDKIFKHDVGPYIHLDQFLAEVERRANRNPKTRSWDMSLGEAKAEATQELAKEIKDGK